LNKIRILRFRFVKRFLSHNSVTGSSLNTSSKRRGSRLWTFSQVNVTPCGANAMKYRILCTRTKAISTFFVFANPTYHFDADPDPMRIQILIFIWCGSGSWVLFDAEADPDPTFHQNPDHIFHIKAQTLKKCSNRLIFHTFWLFICKSMRIRIQLTTLMWSRILILFDADQDPDFLVMRIRIRVPKIMRIRIHNTAEKYPTFESFFVQHSFIGN
jgi:hypothetical protein